MSEKRSGLPRMAGFSIVAFLVYIVGLIVSSVFPESILSILQDLGLLGLAVSSVYYGFRFFRWLKKQLFWKVRNKIIISYAVIGILPVTIMLVISGLVVMLILKTLSGFYLERELEALAETLQDSGRRVAVSYLNDSRERGIKRLVGAIRVSLNRLPAGFGNLRVNVYKRKIVPGDVEAFGLETEISLERGNGVVADEIAPFWLEDEFNGFVQQDEKVSFVSALDLSEGFRIVYSLPFDERVIEYLHRRTSIDLVLSHVDPTQNPREFQAAYSEVGSDLGLFGLNWVHYFQPVEWETGRPTSRTWTIFISVPAQVLLEQFLARGSDFILGIILGLVWIFFFVEVVSLVIGVVIARSITRSIHNIYLGAENIQKGNFDFKVPSRRNDQLDSMADSFNEMSSSIVRLMEQVSEREALEKELEIAKEVQNQLFPQELPEIDSLEIAASCSPARQVSGDYYDFLSYGRSKLDIVLGDISGKGISAALLMASTQAAIRSRLLELEGVEDQPRRMAQVVQEVNRQIYRRSSPESYSTLFLSHYDSGTRELSYCNAGHHPPLVFTDGRVDSMTTGGTVVGLFENWQFQGECITLEPGALVVCFTDGVIEAANAEDEQFGTERLIELIQTNTFLTAEDIQNLVVDQVFDWSAGLEQGDDVTVVCFKVSE